MPSFPLLNGAARNLMLFRVDSKPVLARLDLGGLLFANVRYPTNLARPQQKRVADLMIFHTQLGNSMIANPAGHGLVMSVGFRESFLNRC